MALLDQVDLSEQEEEERERLQQTSNQTIYEASEDDLDQQRPHAAVLGTPSPSETNYPDLVPREEPMLLQQQQQQQQQHVFSPTAAMQHSAGLLARRLESVLLITVFCGTVLLMYCFPPDPEL